MEEDGSYAFCRKADFFVCDCGCGDRVFDEWLSVAAPMVFQCVVRNAECSEYHLFAVGVKSWEKFFYTLHFSLAVRFLTTKILNTFHLHFRYL
jgi:hypothetical protein